MYVPVNFKESNEAHLLEVIRAYPFAQLLLPNPEGVLPLVTHLPLQYVAREGKGYLEGHVSRANPAGKVLEQGGMGMAVFQGPHAYVSSGWYRDTETVPTWNYVAVHVQGPIRVLQEPAAVLGALERLVATYEPANGQWDMATRVTDKKMGGLMKGIVAFELEMAEVQGAFKLSQNRSEGDIERVMTHLAASERHEDRMTAEWMRRFVKKS